MTTTEPSPQKALIRPRSGRIVAGVAAGLACRTEIPVWLVRIGFAVLVPAGGAGLLLYLAGWALIPEEGDSRPAAGRLVDSLHGTRALVGVGLLALAVVIIADNTGVVDGDLALAAVLFVVGMLLYRGELRTGPTRTTSLEEDTMTTPGTATETGPTSQGTTGAVAGGPAVTGAIPHPGAPPAGPPGVVEPPPPPPPDDIPPPPPPPPPRAPRPVHPPSYLGRLTVAATFITLGVMALLEASDAIDIGARHYTAAVLIVLGAGLLVGAVFGRARWLIVVGIFLLPAVLIAPVADVGFRNFGEADRLRFAPTTVGEIEPAYTADVADLVIDLSGVDFAGATVETEARIDAGSVRVILPDDVAVDARGQVNVGRVEVLGRNSGGFGEIEASAKASGTEGTVIVRAEANLGRVEITRDGEPGAPPVGAFDADVEVTSPAELEEEYSVDLGDMTLDLSDLRLENARHVVVSGGAGSVTVILPEVGDYAVDATVASGELETPDDFQSGFDLAGGHDRGDDPVLTMDIEMDLGSIVLEEAS